MSLPGGSVFVFAQASGDAPSLSSDSVRDAYCDLSSDTTTFLVASSASAFAASATSSSDGIFVSSDKPLSSFSTPSAVAVIASSAQAHFDAKATSPSGGLVSPSGGIVSSDQTLASAPSSAVAVVGITTPLSSDELSYQNQHHIVKQLGQLQLEQHRSNGLRGVEPSTSCDRTPGRRDNLTNYLHSPSSAKSQTVVFTDIKCKITLLGLIDAFSIFLKKLPHVPAFNLELWWQDLSNWIARSFSEFSIRNQGNQGLKVNAKKKVLSLETPMQHIVKNRDLQGVRHTLLLLIAARDKNALQQPEDTYDDFKDFNDTYDVECEQNYDEEEEQDYDEEEEQNYDEEEHQRYGEEETYDEI
jgi:hypothetical protein